jgi:hypothetical protein
MKGALIFLASWFYLLVGFLRFGWAYDDEQIAMGRAILWPAFAIKWIAKALLLAVRELRQ